MIQGNSETQRHILFSLSFLVFSAITRVQMPLFFKFGYIKAKMWSLIPFITVILYRKRN